MKEGHSMVNRREFVTHAASAGMAFPMLSWMNSAQAALEGKGKSGRTRSLILLWMGGGPSTIDLWDLKPGSKNGGEFKPISSTGGGQISEHLPRMARVMKNLNIVRSYNSRDGAHERGTYINHTAYAPVPTVVHPSIGGVVASRNSPETLDIPGHICLGGAGLSPGFLGTQYAPFRVEAGPNPIPNLKPPADVSQDRFARRAAALHETQELFARQNRGDNPKDHKIIYDKTFKLMGSSTLNAFKIEQEPEAVRTKYGTSGFAKNCLLARRLVEIGVPFIEVGFAAGTCTRASSMLWPAPVAAWRAPAARMRRRNSPNSTLASRPSLKTSSLADSGPRRPSCGWATSAAPHASIRTADATTGLRPGRLCLAAAA